MSENTKILKKAGWIALYGLVTYGSIKSNNIPIQIGFGFISAYAFNEIIK